MSNFFDDFLLLKQFFEKIITGQGRQLIVLNSFLDSLGHFGLKNIVLPPGTGSGCFQSSQDVVNHEKIFQDSAGLNKFDLTDRHTVSSQYGQSRFTSSVHENYKLRTWGEHVVCINCSECQKKNKNNLCAQHVLPMF